MRSLLKRPYVAIGMGLVALGVGRPASALSVVPMSMQDTIHEAAAIFTGHVLQAQSRWANPEHRFMKTDYLFAVDDAILPNGDVRTGGQVVLTYPGGTIDGIHEGIAGLELPQLGKTYMMMLRNDWSSPRMSPEVRANHGLFRVVQGPTTTEVQESEGQPLFKLTNGMIVRGWERKGATATKGVSFASFTSWIRANLDKIKASPLTPEEKPDPNDPRLMKPIERPAILSPATFKRVEIPESLTAKPTSFEDTGVKLPEPTRPAEPIIVPGAPATATKGEAPSVTDPSQLTAKTFGLPTNGYKIQWSRFNSAPSWRLRIVWNELPTDGSFAPWSPEDQYQMSKWNHYADIYRVLVTPKGTWSWGDGQYDIAGWPSDATMVNQFGDHWGSGVLAITYSRWDLFGLLESDIAFNPAYSWTLDDEWVYDGGSAWPFRATMVHEQGHAWGLNHQFNFISIMNYQEHVFRMFGFPYMDDAEAVRATYSGYDPAPDNMGTYMYRSAGYQDWADLTMTGSVVAGDSVYTNDFHIENVGTPAIGDTTLQWYMTKARNYGSNYYYLGTTDYGGLARFQYFNTWTVGRNWTIPAGVDAGWYYLNTYAPGHANAAGQGGFPFSNRYAWTRNQFYVYPRIYSVVVSPTISPRSSTATGTVYLYGKSDGRWVSLSSSNTGAAQVPSSVWVPSGATSASFSITIPNGGTAANSTITGTLLGYSKSDVAYVVPRTTLTGVNVSGALGQTVTFSATLKNSFNLVAVAGEYIYWYVDGGYVGYGITDANGKAILKYKVDLPLALGGHTIEAYHFTNYSFYGSYAPNTLKVVAAGTKLTMANASIQVGKLFAVKATLKRATDSAALVGYNVNLFVNGVFIGTAVTNSNGIAQINHKFDEAYGLGNVPVSSSFAGSSNYGASTGSAIVTINPSPTAITIKAAAGGRGTTVVLQAVLKRTSDSGLLNGRVLHFYVDGKYVGDGTMSAGVAKRNFFIPATMTVGLHNVQANYDGEAFYLASTKNGSYLTVK